MPELPEVETIVRSLRTPIEDPLNSAVSAGVVGKTIVKAQVFWARSLATPDLPDFFTQIKGQRILSVNRRGKFILFELSQKTMLIHLRMSGDIYVETGKTGRDSKHDRVVLYFTDGSRMVFNDTRKFGRVWLVDDPLQIVGSLGPDPLDEILTAAIFYHKFNSVKRQIKPLLLDQTFIAGLGNIYTDEALFHAGIHPLTPANMLTKEQAAELLKAVRQVLLEGIKRNGASIDWVYRGGDFQNHFQVYQRDGQPCFRCGTTIERITVGQRGTHFCPMCQRVAA